MNRNAVIAIVAVLFLLVLGGIYFFSRTDAPDIVPTPNDITTTPVPDGITSQTVQVFYSNDQLNQTPEDCSVVFGVEREIAPTQAVGRAALQELLGGPGSEEAALGYTTNINPGVTLQQLTIEEGTAFADFSQQLDEGVAGSCRVIAIRAQIEQTLQQFDTVEDVVISVDGETEEILQP